MAYDESMCFCCHGTFGGYYYFTYVRPYIILKSYLHISDITPPRVLSPMTISKYEFFFPTYFSFDFLLYSISYTFQTYLLVDGGLIFSVSMWLHSIITSRNLMNIDTRKYFVNKSASMCSVLQYDINMLLLSTWSFTKNTIYHCSLSYRCTISSHSSPVLSHFGYPGIKCSVWCHILGIP